MSNQINSHLSGNTVLPGDNVSEILKAYRDDENKPVIVGPGLKRLNKQVINSYKAGQLLHRPVNLFWINSHQRYYIPCERDTVVGVVISKTSTFCRVDIGASEAATLSLMAFPNATKRNKAIVEIGDVLFACVLSASKDVETELVCMDKDGKKDGFGVLPRGGYMIKVPLNICRRLLASDSKISRNLGRKYRFEKTVGLNGRIWIRSKSIQTTILISNFIKQLEYVSDDQQDHVLNLLEQKMNKNNKK
ncbi:exosome complex component Rrp40 [Dermatophagoides farinae]|uniref:Ribosomal RNA-processing protein 40 n=1 Tax=Dermatophagoides farinae TaxID=6954 RepID=A0A922ICL3_DERFA|nr:Exosome component 3 [Dermatophagoides farinae]